MTAKEAVSEIRKRLEKRRDQYRDGAASIGDFSDRFRQEHENHATSMSEALVIVGEVENLLKR